MERLTTGRRTPMGAANLRIAVAAILAMLLTGACAAPALACGACTDRGMALTMPWLPVAMPLVWAWILVMFAGRVALRLAGRAERNQFVAPWTLICFAALSTGGVVLLSIVSQGSALFPCLVIGIVWVGFLLVRVVVQTPQVLSRRSGGIGVAAWLIHLGFLAATVGAVVLVSIRCNTPEYHIQKLDYHVSATYSVSMPKIIAFGDASVGPLIEEGNKCLRSQHLRDRSLTQMYLERKLFGVAFCLGEIGGPEAETWLGEVLRRDIDLVGFRTPDWQRAVCYAYAKCARAQAVDALIALHSKLTADDSKRARPAVLLAILLTASRRGVLFVLDHMDELLGAEQDDEQAAHVAAAALVFGNDPTMMESLPVHRHILLFGPPRLPKSSQRDFSDEFYWTSTNQTSPKSDAEIRAAWAADRDKIRDRWSRILK